jgi:precorrin-2/cobalt-factor-2 C20-methyltransferase
MTHILEQSGTLYGLGLGPGDPELITLKAHRLLQAVPVVAHFAKKGRRGNAALILDAHLSAGQEVLTFSYPVTTEIPFGDLAYKAALSAFYADCTAQLAGQLAGGRDVALVCEGDPLFYGSFMHLYQRLRETFKVEIVPAVTGMSGGWTALGEPMTWGDDVLSVLPATLPHEALVARLKLSDAAVFMKMGRNLAKVRQALREAGLYERAFYVERATMAGQKVMSLADKTDDEAPYFALVLVPGQGRRP